MLVSPGHTGMRGPLSQAIQISYTEVERPFITANVAVVIHSAMKRNLLCDRIDMIMTWIAEIIG